MASSLPLPSIYIYRVTAEKMVLSRAKSEAYPVLAILPCSLHMLFYRILLADGRFAFTCQARSGSLTIMTDELS